jgi:hypothetical protein
MTNRFLLAITIALVSSATTFAQDSPAGFDSRWNPYLGCWTVAQEQFGQQRVSVPSGTMVCVRPSGRSGVAITTTVDGKTVLEQTIVADGSTQALSQGDCNGTQTSDWSRDGERLFTRVTLDCAGRPARNVSGITMMAKGHWVDVQATVVDNDHDLRVRRYRRSSDPYTGMPAMAAAPFNVEDVIEASAKVHAPAVEAALLEVGGRFTLNSRVLKQLADAKVSPNVIDLMVAQAYPERFDIDTGVYPPVSVASGATATSGGNTTVIMGSSAFPYPVYDPFYNSYYYYSPFAYPYYWGAGYRYRYGYPYYNYYNYYGYPGYAYPGYGGSINSGGPGGSGIDYAPPGTSDSRGASGIATGRGYTRVRPAGSGDSGGGDAAVPTSRSGNVGRGTRGVDTGSTPASSSSSSSPSSSSSGSTGASSGGYSSGGGGDTGGGRTAQPR